MGSSITLTAVANWARPILKMQPLSVTNMEPALTNANIVLQTMLGAPFRWRFNRNSFNFTTVPATGTAPIVPAVADYPLYLPDFGWLEDQWIADPTTGEVYAIAGAVSLPMPTKSPGRVTAIAAQGDDNAGNISFRTKELCNKAYTISGEYQKKAIPLQSVASTFAPVPDEFAFVFDWGFLTIASLLVNDARFPRFEQYFISRLLGLQDGLDEVAINLFIGNWQAMTATIQRGSGKVQQGLAGRNV